MMTRQVNVLLCQRSVSSMTVQLVAAAYLFSDPRRLASHGDPEPHHHGRCHLPPDVVFQSWISTSSATFLLFGLVRLLTRYLTSTPKSAKHRRRCMQPWGPTKNSHVLSRMAFFAYTNGQPLAFRCLAWLATALIVRSLFPRPF